MLPTPQGPTHQSSSVAMGLGHVARVGDQRDLCLQIRIDGLVTGALLVFVCACVCKRAFVLMHIVLSVQYTWIVVSASSMDFHARQTSNMQHSSRLRAGTVPEILSTSTVSTLLTKVYNFIAV